MNAASRLVAALLLLAPASASAEGTRATYAAGTWVYRAGWIQLGVGTALVTAWGLSSNWGASDTSDTLLWVGGVTDLAAPLTMATGSLIARQAATSEDPRLTMAPGTWAIGAEMFCVGGFALNVAQGLSVPPVLDCSSAVILPAWQQGLNHAAFREQLRPEEDDDFGAKRPPVQVAAAPLLIRNGAGIGLAGSF